MTNLGVEMVYILEQRLKAQQIPKEKATEFLKDVVLTMFEANFYSEVFRPQEVYTIGATRQIFDRLAHSSIMRLSTSSMDKLYDLMLMGLKYQMLCIRKPSDILKVTQLHLNNVKRMVEDQEVQARINDVLQFTESTYSGFSALNWIQLRQALARFLKDKRVKVSLFLQEGIQTQEGKILLPLPLPENPSVPQPGTLNILNDAGEVQSVKTFRMESVEVDTALFHCHPHSLGDNLYDKSRPPFMPPTSRSAAKAASPHVTRDDAGINSPKTFAKPARREITTGVYSYLKGAVEDPIVAILTEEEYVKEKEEGEGDLPEDQAKSRADHRFAAYRDIWEGLAKPDDDNGALAIEKEAREAILFDLSARERAERRSRRNRTSAESITLAEAITGLSNQDGLGLGQQLAEGEKVRAEVARERLASEMEWKK